jgi:uncharacterized protein YjbI with pentapeptide repeats
MANEEHLGLLQQGVDVWNAWRTNNSSIRPDLRTACLGDAQLEGVNLSWSGLGYANLSGATVSAFAHMQIVSNAPRCRR